MSPLFYSNLISVTNQIKKAGVKPGPNGKIPFTYRSELIFQIMEEIKTLHSFGTNEIILAFDNSQGNYWRKDYYDRYKYKRQLQREESDIDWDSAFEIFDDIKTLLKNSSSFKVVEVPKMEADDIAFTLAEYLQDRGGVILHSLDHDWEHALKYKNVKLFKTRKTQRKSGIFVEKTPEELHVLEETHCIAGDPGDGFLHIKAWSQFSPIFLEEYPNFKGKELQLYNRHHLIEHQYNLKNGFDTKKQAYKHPRFGYKSWKKSKIPLKDLLKENPIYKKNYMLNKNLALPINIPGKYKNLIIDEYNRAKTEKSPGELQKYFINNNLFDLTGIISFL